MDISGLDKAAILAALFNGSRQQGLGLFDPNGRSQMTVEEARVEIDNNPKHYFDYLRGRVLKIDLSKNELFTGLYNRDNGTGAAEAIIDDLKKRYGLI